MDDLNLSEPVKDLWAEVEELYGMSIDLIVTDLSGATLGEADVLPDGQPRIKIDRVRGMSNQNVAHELLHFKLKQEGYGTYSY